MEPSTTSATRIGRDIRNSDTERTPELDNGIQPRPDHSAGGNSEEKQRMLQSDHSPTLLESRPPTPMSPPEGMPSPPPPVAPPPRTRTRKQKDQNTPNPIFPTQATATSADTSLSQSEHRGPYPTMVQRIAGLLRKPQELMSSRGKTLIFWEGYKTSITEEPGGNM